MTGAGRHRRLTAEECQAIADEAGRGTRAPSLATIYGVHINTIYNVLRRMKPTRPTPLGAFRPDRSVRPGRHVIAEISYRLEVIECSCGVVVTAPADELEPERHQPLCDAWQGHRRSVGAKVLSVAQDAMLHRAYS